MDINVNTNQLKEILAKNLVAHNEDYKEAKAAYKEACMNELESMVNELKETGKLKRTSIKAPKPVRYSKHYERAIQMLDLHTGQDITLAVEEYTKFVQDEWTWSREFAANTLSYKNG